MMRKWKGIPGETPIDNFSELFSFAVPSVGRPAHRKISGKQDCQPMEA
jgi:hypothetical protein